MANIFLAWQNRVDEGTLSGGSWLSTLPITNMQTRQVQKVARTTNAANASTLFTLDLGSAKQIGVLAAVVHNMSVTAKVRVRGSASSTGFTNLLVSPTDYSNAAWSKTNITVTPAATTAPDGTSTAIKLAATAAAATSVVQVVTATATTHAHTIYIRRGSGDTHANLFLIQNVTTATNIAYVSVNYATGVLTPIGPQVGTATIQQIDADWWRLTLESAAGISVGNTLSIYNCFTGAVESAGEFAYVFQPALLAGAAPAYDSAWVDVWPAGVIPTELLEWEDDNFWLGTLSAEARAGFQSPFILRLPAVTSARYWRVEIFDASNGDGYIQIGRLFMARGWTPTVNYAYGAGLGYDDPTPVDTSLSGAEFFDQRSKYRVMTFRLEYITEPEAYSYALELQRLAGISGEVLVMPDGGENIGQQPLRSFVGRLRQLGQIGQPKPTAYTAPFEIKELL